MTQCGTKLNIRPNFNKKGRGESVRLAMIIGEIPFVDDRVKSTKWAELKPKTPLGSLPVAEIDGEQMVQSVALLRYVGRLTNLYPKDAFKALQVDQVIETVQDFFSSLFTYKGTDKSKFKSARETALANASERYWGGCQRIIERISDGPYVLGEELSIADLVIAAMYTLLRYDYLEHIPRDALDKYEKMKAIFDKVIAIPRVRAYYEEHPFPGLLQ